MGALQSAVSGLSSHQTWLDVAGNNLANLNTPGFKSSSVNFAELLSQTVKAASGPQGSLGGTNPQQLGSGVGVASIPRNMSQGNISSTGQDLDVAIDGEGFFVLSDGTQSLYTRVGSFGIDKDYNLVDPATGNKVQRTGTIGEAEGFQTVGVADIRIPLDAALPANATTSMVINGNLRVTDNPDASINVLTGDLAFTTGSGAAIATGTDTLISLDQYTAGADPFDVAGAGPTAGTFVVTGYAKTDYTDAALITSTLSVTAATTVQNMLDQLSTDFAGSTFTLDTSGQLTMTDDASGYSHSRLVSATYNTSVGGTEVLTPPTFFDTTQVGGDDIKTFNSTIYDALGTQHNVTGKFVKTNVTNTWDLVLTSVSGELDGAWSSYDIGDPAGAFNRRISGVQFNTDGSYNGLASSTESLSFGAQFTAGTTQTMAVDFGTIGLFTGLTQFAAPESTAAVATQDGYAAGELSGVSIDGGGAVVGTFTNGIKTDLAMLQIALFQNAGGLEALSNGNYIPSANSGDPQVTLAASGGAGSLKSKSLEKSNVDVASEFVNMMQAQNGYQSNARTIKVANDMLRELTNLIR